MRRKHKHTLPKQNPMEQPSNRRFSIAGTAVLVAALFIAGACNNEPAVTSTLGLYKVGDFIHSEIIRLEQSHIGLSKTIERDRRTEQKEFSVINWKEELQPFADCDLNRPSWIMEYKGDTLVHGDTTDITYETTLEKLPVRSMHIRLIGNKLQELDIITKKKNSYFMSRQELHYRPESGYVISGVQKVILAKATIFSIRGTFKQP